MRRPRARLGLGRARRSRRGRSQEPGQAGEVGLQHLEHGRRVERCGRVVDRIEQHAAACDRQLLLLAVHTRDPERPAGEELGGEVAQRRDHLRLDQLDLAEEVRLARLDLVLLRVAVAGRTALEDVRDVDVLPPQLDAREQPVEQLPRLADEGDALLVLVEARRFADEHQVRARIAGAEDDLRPALRQPTARAARGRCCIRLERLHPSYGHGTHRSESTRHARRTRSAPASARAGRRPRSRRPAPCQAVRGRRASRERRRRRS